MRRKVFFRADGGGTTGLGHIVRCSALADMLKDDFDCHFLIQEPSPDLKQFLLKVSKTVTELPADMGYDSEPGTWIQALSGDEIVVLDGYDFTTAYQQQIKQKGCKLICIDDIYNTRFVADAVINHAPGIPVSAYKVEPYTAVLLGTDFLLLRKPFLDAVKSRRGRSTVENLFVCFGGSDFNNLTSKALDAAMLTDRFSTVHLVVGSAFSHTAALKDKIAAYDKRRCDIRLHCNLSAENLAAVIAECDVAICPTSSILFEACAVGIGLVSGFYVDNQKNIFEYLNETGLFAGAGDFNRIAAGDIAEKLARLDLDHVNHQIDLQKKLVDGQSFKRLKKLFHKLDKEFTIKGRKVTSDDIALLYEWANDPETRANAINSSSISWEEHVQWFNKKMGDDSSHAFIFEQIDNEKEIGLVRFDHREDKYLISYLVGKESRGNGWGEIILKQGIAALTASIGYRPSLRALVKEGNIPSVQIFLNLGFISKDPVEINSIIYKVYEKE